MERGEKVQTYKYTISYINKWQTVNKIGGMFHYF